MAEKKKAAPKVAKREAPKEDPEGFIKGYDIKWLKQHPEHPDFHLVAKK